LYESEEERLSIEAQLAQIKAKYGERLDEAAEKTVVESLINIYRRAATLRKVALTGADEPLLYLVPKPLKREA
jgi:chorismate mutase